MKRIAFMLCTAAVLGTMSSCTSDADKTIRMVKSEVDMTRTLMVSSNTAADFTFGEQTVSNVTSATFKNAPEKGTLTITPTSADYFAQEPISVDFSGKSVVALDVQIAKKPSIEVSQENMKNGQVVTNDAENQELTGVTASIAVPSETTITGNTTSPFSIVAFAPTEGGQWMTRGESDGDASVLVLRCAADGAKFSEPVTVTLDIPESDGLDLYCMSEDGQEVLPFTEVGNSKRSVKLSHFSDWITVMRATEEKTVTRGTTGEEISTFTISVTKDVPVQISYQSKTGDGFTVAWPAVSGAAGYELELTAVNKASDDPAEALLYENNLDKFKTSSQGFSDVSGSLSNYGLSNWKGDKLFTSPKKMLIGTSGTAGYIQTPSWWRVPSSQQMTFVMGAETHSSSSSVTGTVTFESAIEGGTLADVVTENAAFEVTNGKYVFSFNVPSQSNLYRLTISPNKRMYLNYLAIYDGTWTPEQLGINTSSAAPRFAQETTTHTTNTNSITLTGLDTNKRYIYRVRAYDSDKMYSQWSVEQTFEFGATAILGIRTDVNAPVRYFDLSGREVDASARGVIIIKQGNTTKKVVR